jgi:hypothetical protein
MHKQAADSNERKLPQDQRRYIKGLHKEQNQSYEAWRKKDQNRFE